MTIQLRHTCAGLLMLGCLGLAAPGETRDRWRDSRHDRRGGREPIAYDNGYRAGFEHGERDRRNGRDFSYAHDAEFRDADRGYRRELGDRETYRLVFRDGYVAGYTDGYQAGTSGHGDDHDGWERGRRGRAVPRREPFPNGRRDPDWYPSRYPGTVGYNDVAHDNGYADGYEKGLDDGRDNDRYDPVRHGWYRSADRGYDRRLGSREQYKNAYRSGFRSGYDAGHRDGQRFGSRGGVRRGRWNLPWPF